jgi:hypothetical protein
LSAATTDGADIDAHHRGYGPRFMWPVRPLLGHPEQ